VLKVEKRENKMKKIIPVIGLFIVYLLVFIPVAYARQSDHKPSDIAINNAVYWAESFEGRTSFPVTGTTNGSRWSLIGCGDFVANAYGHPASPHKAAMLWNLSVVQHAGDWNAPRGSLVFFGPSPLNGELGHVALSTGNGNFIEAGPELISTGTIIAGNRSAPYLGWAWPPLAWPGRSDIFKATAFTWAIQTGKAIVLTIMSWLAFLMIESTIARIKQSRIGHGIVEKVNET
jgi:cell wall-associated NlpC family hydrolase